MIPMTLELRNFLSYRGPTVVDFTSFGVACLSGANGQGKSSLLDAMTWALFGAARGCEGGQNQDRLIHDGADEAEIGFTFELADAVYRIVRTRARSGRADVRFLVRSAEGWTNIAGDTLRETEGRIGRVLRMDYRTFTASAFFLQGRAEDFLTRMRPEERKEVFARLLDLGVYERLEGAARERARDAEVRRREYGRRAEELASVPEERARAAEELSAAEEALQGARAELAAAEAELEAARAECTELERDEAVAERERRALEELEGAAERDRQALAACERERAQLDGLLEQAPEVSAALEEAERLRGEEARLRRLQEQHAALEHRRVELRAQIDAETHALHAEIRTREQRTAALQQELRGLESERATLERLDRDLARGGDLEGEVERVRGVLADLRERDARLREQRRRLESLETGIDEKLELLEGGGGECPVCGGPLDAEHRRRLARELTAERKGAERDLERTGAEREEVRKEGRRLAEEEKRLGRSLDEARRLEAQRTAVGAKLERIPTVAEELETEQGALRDARDTLEREAYAQAAREELRRLAREHEGLGYEQREHERVRERLERLGSFAQLQGRIDEARERKGRLLADRDALQERTREAERLVAERREAVSALLEALRRAPEIRERGRRARAAVDERRAMADSAAADRARLAERLDALGAREEELERVRAAEGGAADEGRRYTRLGQAFGRGGIPDRIIENALPELTAEANEILGRLTDHEMSVSFAMDRLTRAGKVRETFDVLVHHEGAVRDFQMFSGGEAFRIAFAIRLGLSKLLVRRAGARLETLVIDEGFGTQDPEGRERVVEAINLARSEFRKVLVISHIDELKDTFGAQLRVVKDPERGSGVQALAG